MDWCFALILTLARSQVSVIIENALVSTVIALCGWLFKKNSAHFLPFQTPETCANAILNLRMVFSHFLPDRTWSKYTAHGPFQTCAVYFRARLCVLLHTKTLVCHCWYYHLVLSYEMYFLGNQLTRVQNTYLGTHNEQDPGPL